MSTISSNASYLASQYYQLPGQSQGSNTGSSSSSSSSSSSVLDTLNSIFGNTDTTASSSSSVLDTIDLSPQAQSILDALSSGSSSSSSTTTGTNNSFMLTPAQQSKISAILAQYKDAPQTQATFEKIQDDLTAAGLSPKQLAQSDSIQSFNATQTFLDALNGKTDAIPTADSSDEQTKSDNYMQGIISEWKNMSGSSTASTDGGTDTMSSGAA